MGKWMDLAAKLASGENGGDNRDNRDNSPPNVPIVPNVPASLPADIRSGLAALRIMAAPPITKPEVWPGIVADALRLATNPDVAAALRTGWHPLHFWGCCPSADADPALEGLAVRLMGRKPLIYDTHAIMESAAATHSVFTPRGTDGAIFLWDLGRTGQ